MDQTSPSLKHGRLIGSKDIVSRKHKNKNLEYILIDLEPLLMERKKNLKEVLT